MRSHISRFACAPIILIVSTSLFGQNPSQNDHVIDSLLLQRELVTNQIRDLYVQRNQLKHDILLRTKKAYPYGKPIVKGNWYGYFSFPHINSFLLKPEDEGIKSNTGFWGVSSGLDYFYATNKYVEMSIDLVSDFFVPVPAAVDIFGEYELMTSSYIAITNNTILRRFSLGYGVVFAKNVWDLREATEILPGVEYREAANKQQASLGVIFASKLRIKKNVFIGLKYRPTFIRFGGDPILAYEHLISFDLGFRFLVKADSK